MKRDMDLVRDLMIAIADETYNSDDWDQRSIYHLKLLTDIAYLDGLSIFGGGKGDTEFFFSLSSPQLTWQGHELLDKIRSKTFWEQIKKVLGDKGVDLSIETIKLAASSLLTQIVK
jgi:hypothetical protein